MDNIDERTKLVYFIIIGCERNDTCVFVFFLCQAMVSTVHELLTAVGADVGSREVGCGGVTSMSMMGKSCRR